MDYLFPDSALLIFCKAPVPGYVKTRLQPALSAEQAVAAHLQLTDRTLELAFYQPLCPVRLYCAPDMEHPFFERCATNYPLTLAAQRGADLGERMLTAFKEALSRYRHAILVGCDCPSLTPGDLRESLDALRNGYDLVLGAAEDGGYVLIGLNVPQPALFQDMMWSTNTVTAETRRRAAEKKLRVHELATQWDVDGIEGWKRFAASRSDGKPSSQHRELNANRITD